MPKKIDAALRDRAVRLVTDHREQYPSITAACAAVARQLGVGKESVRRWVVQADVDAGTRPGITSEEHAEIKRLKAENRDCVRMSKSCVRQPFFAGELDPRSR